MKIDVSLIVLLSGALSRVAADDWGEYGDGDDAGFAFGGEGLDDPNAALVGAAMAQSMEMAAQCDIDISGAMALLDGGRRLEDVGTGMTSDYKDILKSAVSLFPDTCNQHQAHKFEAALRDFETCSSFNLETIMEAMFDSFFGVLIECVLAVAPVADDFLAAMEDDASSYLEFEIPDLCVESFLGQNPLGDMLRTYALYPDRVLPCFASLSESIPPCTLQRWPIPLIGPLLKKATCLTGSATPLLEEVAVMNLQALQSCVPSDISPTQCEDIKDVCALSGSSAFLLPKPLLGSPLSDLSKRVASEQGLDDVVAGYEAFVHQCVPEVWKGWSYANGQYDNQESDADDTTILGSSSSSQVPSASSGSGSDSGGISGWTFLSGMAFGMIVSAAVSAFLIYRKRQEQNDHQPIFAQSADDSIELT